MYFQHLAISGELGSGKSSVARALGKHFGMTTISTGDMQREIASSLRLSTLDTNYVANTNLEIDDLIDGRVRDLGSQDTPVVFDSRLAWHFAPKSFKIHFLVDGDVAARRIFDGRSDETERYSSLEEARSKVEARYQTERHRFFQRYGLNVAQLSNYDLVIDTSDASAEEVVKLVIDVLEGKVDGPQRLWISPRRVVPTSDVSRELSEFSTPADWDVPVVGYSRPFIFCLRGHQALSNLVLRNARLCPAFLEVEGDEEVVAGISAAEYLRREPRLSWIYDWEEIHGYRFSSYPSLEA